MRSKYLIAAFVIIFCHQLNEPSLRAKEMLKVGAGSFEFVDTVPERSRKLVVWYYLPKGFKPTGEVVFVMHGTKRNGDDYRDNWISLAQSHSFLIIAPEFSKEEYPGTRQYQFGNILREDGSIQPSSEWSVGVIDRIFDRVVQGNQLKAEQYVIFGHSAGSQFVHRMMLASPSARARLAITANAGSYTMPDFQVDYPYGLRGSATTKQNLVQSLSKKMIVLLGEEDNDINHKYLPKAPAAMAQGKHRFDRGHTFFQKAKEQAEDLGCDFNWQKVTVPDVGHENAKMAMAAAKLIVESRRSQKDIQHH